MSGIPYKKCTGPCGQEYPATLEFFTRDKRIKSGLKAKCKICANNASKEWREQNREYDYARKKAWNEANAEHNKEVAIRRRERTKEHRAKWRVEYYTKNRDSLREKSRQYYYQHRDEISSRGKIRRQNKLVQEHQKKKWKEYYAKNRHTLNKKARTWQENNRDRQAVRESNRRAVKKSISGSYTLAQIQDQLKRQKHKCYYCQNRLKKVKGRYQYHIEHTFPISRVAGTNMPVNDISYLVLACSKCNQSKKDKFPWEFPEGGRLL